MKRHPPQLLKPGTKSRSPFSESAYPLPPELLAQARRRLEYLVLFLTAVLVLAALLSCYFLPLVGIHFPEADLARIQLAQWGAAAFQFLFFLLLRIKRLPDRLVLTMVLVYEIVLCFSVSCIDGWFVHSRTGFVPHLNFASLVIAVYPLIVPSPPLPTLLSALALAATVPLALAVLARNTEVTVQGGEYFTSLAVPIVSAGLAYMGSRLIYRLNSDIAEARRLGSYRLQHLLGRGGMGEVWAATHQMLARPAAIQLIRPEALGGNRELRADRLLSRFEREAQATARMRCPRTIQIYDFGVSEDGRL